MRRVLLPLALLALAPVFGGCPLLSGGDDCDGYACTEEFRTLTVRIVDEGGQPVEGLTTTSTNLRTGEAMDLEPDLNEFGEGVYAVASDNHTDDVREEGDTIRFRAEGRGLVAEADFVIGTGPCACHIEKVSGPEELVARPE